LQRTNRNSKSRVAEAINHPEETITAEAIEEYLAVRVLYYAWLIVTHFHDLEWID
jgi:hypothetical protein